MIINVLDPDVLNPERKMAEHYAGVEAPLAVISANGHEVKVYCQGEMRIHYNGDIFRYPQDLHRAGFDTDEKIGALYEAEFALEGDEVEVVHNPWFELDVDGEWQGWVFHDIDEALFAAKMECAA